MLKIVPFLVWYRAYAPRVGRAAVPTLAALGWPAAERLALVLLVAGIALLAVGVAAGHSPCIAAAGSLIASGALAFAATLGRVLHHLTPGPAHALSTAGRGAR